MNCREFSQVILEIARGRLLEAAARQGALAHAEACAPCAARLNDERALNKGLQALAEANRAELNAPSRVEANLLAALRSQSARKPIAAPVFRRTVAWGRWATAAAALVALTVSVSFWREVTNKVPAFAASARPSARAAQSWPLPVFNEEKTVAPRVYRSAEAAPTQMISYRPAALTNRLPANKINQRRISAPPFNQELTTEFFPLNGAESYPATDEMQLVRVRLPRSAMATFGLPFAAERANERVTADVMIGADGLARAVRFVR